MPALAAGNPPAWDINNPHRTLRREAASHLQLPHAHCSLLKGEKKLTGQILLPQSRTVIIRLSLAAAPFALYFWRISPMQTLYALSGAESARKE